MHQKQPPANVALAEGVAGADPCSADTEETSTVRANHSTPARAVRFCNLMSLPPIRRGWMPATTYLFHSFQSGRTRIAVHSMNYSQFTGVAHRRWRRDVDQRSGNAPAV